VTFETKGSNGSNNDHYYLYNCLMIIANLDIK